MLTGPSEEQMNEIEFSDEEELQPIPGEHRRLFPEMTVKGPSDEDIAYIEFSDEEEEEKKG
jgi:hypothetical protein